MYFGEEGQVGNLIAALFKNKHSFCATRKYIHYTYAAIGRIVQFPNRNFVKIFRFSDS